MRVLGTDPQGAGLEWRNRVGIVLQSTGGLDLLTPREALASTAKAYSHPRDVADVLTSVGLDDKADTRIVGLSGGQRRRLDVALGIVGRPELLFLDEPTTGFDPQARRDFWVLIRDLAAEGTTILLTTHYLDEAEHLADRVGVIAAGRLLAVDTPAALGGRSAEEATVSWEEDGVRRTITTVDPHRRRRPPRGPDAGWRGSRPHRHPTLARGHLPHPHRPPRGPGPDGGPRMRAVALGVDRTLLELKMYSREKEAVFFSFLFPILLLALFSVIFSSQFAESAAQDGMTAGGYFLPGMLSAGVLLTSFQTMAMSVTAERDDGTLKRLRATPMPPVAYFLGKVGLVAVSSTVQVALLLLVARVFFGVELPSTADRWAVFALIFALGVFGGTVLGIAYSSMATARTVGAVVIGPMLVLQFISGVYIAFDDVPQWLQQVAAVFPLKWIAQGMRSVFFPEQLASAEMAGAWETGRTAMVLAVWAVGGLVLCVLTFKWFKRGTT